MELKSTQNGGIVVVDSGFGERLLEGGGWEVVGALPEDAPVDLGKPEAPVKKKPAPKTKE